MFTSSSSQKTLVVSVFLMVLIAIFLSKPKGPKEPKSEVEKEPVGISKLLKKAKKAASKPLRKPVAQLKPTEYDAIGSKNKNVPRDENTQCDESAPLDSPEYKKCSTLVGSARNVIPGDPKKTANNINTEFVKENFQGEEEKVGNPFAKSLKQNYSDESFLGSSLLKPKTDKTEDSKLGETLISKSTLPISEDAKKALPFAKKGSERDGGLKKAPFRSTLTLGDSAVSPVGMSQEEVEQSARRLDDVNIVQQTTGGQLNLLVHRP